MLFQIKEIILWAKKPALKPRRVEFKPGVVNVISGVSRTGKSAIIPIIDYCLGSDKCTIPVNTIRDACEWFGVLVQTIEGEKLFARREPGVQKSTGDMFMLEAMEVEIPEKIISKTNTVDFVKRKLDELAGLTALDFDVENLGVGFKGRPSFRDLGAFTYQPQNIVANPNVLFYKADTHEHREKLRTIFPYVLDAITPALLAKLHELNQLRRELKRKQSELANLKAVSERWLAEIKSKVSDAMEFGLAEHFSLDNATRDQLITVLKGIVQRTNIEARTTSETISEAINELVKLHKEESDISLELSALRKRQAEMAALRESAFRYKGALQIQRERLKISEWVGEIHKPDHDCPLCGNSLQATTNELNLLKQSLVEIERDVGEFDAIPASFDREYERVRVDVRIATDRIKAVRFRIEALERRSDEAKQRQYDTLKVSRFIGNVEQSLETYEKLGADSDLMIEVEELKARVKALDDEISEAAVRDKERRALKRVGQNAGKLMPELDAERPNDPVSLSTTDLTIKVEGINREDYLWEIGSGSNWLAYHVAISLALQQFFLELKATPVPSLLVYDQPSQVYFPKRLADKENEGEEGSDPLLRDEDVEALQKVFKVLSKVVAQEKGNLQVIVLDHAPKAVWGGIPNIHLVDEWREGKKLIPPEWLI
jgi:hypothetical protein